MPFNVTCPNCKKTLRVPDRFLGVRAKCKFCQTPILVEIAEDAPNDPGLQTMELPTEGNVFEQQTMARTAPPAPAAPSGNVFEQSTVAGTAPAQTTTTATAPERSKVSSPATAPALERSKVSNPAAVGPPAPTGKVRKPSEESAGYEEEDEERESVRRGPPPLPPRPPKPPKLKIGSLVVSILSLAVICGSIAGIIILRQPATAVVEQPAPQGEKYAAIALESGGVRLVIAPIQKTNGGYTLGDQILKNREVSIVPKGEKELNPAKLSEAMKEVGQFVKLCKENEVPADHLFVLCNSSVLRDLEGTPGLAKAKASLEEGVRQAGGGKLIYVAADDEARYGVIGCVPVEDRTTAVFLDLGNGSLRCGYHETDGTFIGFDIPQLGRRKFTDTVKKEQKGGSFAPVAESLRGNSLNVPLQKEGNNRPALVNRKTYHLAGGGAWAAAVLTRPAELGQLRVKLGEADIAKFDQLVSDPSLKLDALRSQLIDKIQGLPDGERKHAESEIRMVTDRFDLNALVASAKVLRALSDECDFKSKDVRFFTNSLYAWPIGFLLARSGVEK